MSLNGLDNPAIQEAYQQSLAEAGGWFLLKYTSRDSVELLSRGKGGVHEARTAIGQYEEASPLYGLLVYRRRKVLIKFIPEGTSRLLQARTTVHFRDVIQRYQPYETLLEITTPEGLNDTSLAASFPLHTASPSASSHRLHEISEDGEDSGPMPQRPSYGNASPVGSVFGTQRYETERRVDPGMRYRRPTPSIQITQDESMSPLSSPLSSPQKASISHFLVREDSGQRSIISLGSPTSMTSMTDYAASEASGKSAGSDSMVPELSRAQSHFPAQTERLSQTSHASLPDGAGAMPNRTADSTVSESEERSIERASVSDRPSISGKSKYEFDEPYDFSKFDIKPKVKLGPRPVVVGDKTKRPMVASIATVPATYRPTQKKQEPATAFRPKSQGPVTLPTLLPPGLPTPPPIPNIPEYNPRPLSIGSVKSLPSHKSTAMTPDKVRLMKAVELRKKQLRKSNSQDKASSPPKVEDVPAVPKVSEIVQEEPVKPAESESESKTSMDIDQHAPSNKADSGIGMGYVQHEKHEDEKPREEPQAEAEDEARKRAEQLEEQPTESTNQPCPETVPPRPSSPESEPNNEPTMSLDMLGEDVKPLPGLTGASSIDNLAAGNATEVERLGITMPLQQYNRTVPSIATVEVSRPNTANGAFEGAAHEDPSAFEDFERTGDGIPTRDALEAPTLEAPPRQARWQNNNLAKRRRGMVEPLHIESHAESDLGSDDDFLEELHSATLQEAKPVTVARSPMAASLGRGPSAQSLVSNLSIPSAKSVNVPRSPSNPPQMSGDEPDRASPELNSTSPRPERSVSASTPAAEENDPMAGLKRNVSTGIQKRIQTLAEVTSRDTSPSGQDTSPRPVSPETSPNFSQRDRPRSVRPPTRSRTGSYKAAARHSARANSYASAPDGLHSQSSENAPIWNVQHDPASQRDSVKVSARIIRPSADVQADPSTQPDVQLQQSQLVINHKRASQQQSHLNTALPLLNTNANPSMYKSDSAPSVASSPGLSPVMTRASTEFRTLHSANRKSYGRHKQPQTPITPTADDFPPPPSQRMPTPVTSLASNDENAAAAAAAPKEGSRTSRFFKRMSNLGGGSKRRQSGAQQSLGSSSSTAGNTDMASLTAGNPSFVHSPQDRSDMPPGVVVGDLNVQFPDSLLWKRRMVEIDEAGNVFFSTPQAFDIHRRATKRYHLTEFRQPYAPDLERQELPYSVMLDCIDGTTLQAACEDGMTHRQVLYVLRMYWKAWAGAAGGGGGGGR